MSTRVALIVDHPYRDLPGLVLVATALCQEGVTCYLVPFNLLNREIWLLAPDFVLLNYLRTNNQRFAGQLTKAGIRFGVLDTEGGVLASLESYGEWLAEDPQIRQQTACFCSWGERLGEYVRTAGWFSKEQISITGSPSYDFYAHPWRAAALRASEYANRYDSNLVLVNGNFSLANPRFVSPAEEVEVYVRTFGRERDAILAWQQAEHQTMLELTALINRLADRFPHLTFVYRPHPFERTATYRDLLDSRDNLHLVKSGTVTGWILRASAIIQRGCSTAIEAGIVGVPAITPAWIPAASERPAVEAVSLQCRSEAELTDTLKAIVADQFELPATIQERLAEVVRDWFFRIDGQAYRRVAECILGNLPAKVQVGQYSTWSEVSSRFRLRTKSLRSMADVTLRRLLDLPSNWSHRRWGVLPGSLPWEESEKYFDAEQVRVLVNAIQMSAQDGSKKLLGKIGVLPAHERGDYGSLSFPGRSVTIFPRE